MFYIYIHYLYTHYKKLYLSAEINEKQLLTLKIKLFLKSVCLPTFHKLYKYIRYLNENGKKFNSIN